MGQFHAYRFPGESDAYREARDRLLAAERELRRKVEDIAALRRNLPAGGRVQEDYVFEEGAPDLTDLDTVRQTRFSDLFAPGKDTLVLYSLMYPPGGAACPMCTAFLDSLNGSARHVGDQVNLAVVAKAPIRTIREFAASRGWDALRFLSSNANSYNRDYFSESADGDQWPLIHVFRRDGQGIHHTYASELFFAPGEEGMHPRHVDALWPLWNVLDLTPDGRGSDWWPKISYE